VVQQSWILSMGRAVVALGAVLGAVSAASGDTARTEGPAPALAQAIALLERAEVTYEPAELQQAIDAFDRLARQDGKNPQYPYYLGRAYFPLINVHDYQGNTAMAEKAGEQGLKFVRTAIRLDETGNPDAYRLLGDYYGRLSVFRGALGRLRYGAASMKNHNKAQEMDPRNVLTVIGVGTDRMFAPSAFGGDMNQAVALFAKAVEMAPSSPLGHVWLGRAYAKLKKHDLARQHFEKALALEPRSAFARNEYERAYREMAAH
jgi:tetratricopeptide (TPR) repeat protein